MPGRFVPGVETTAADAGIMVIPGFMEPKVVEEGDDARRCRHRDENVPGSYRIRFVASVFGQEQV